MPLPGGELRCTSNSSRALSVAGAAAVKCGTVITKTGTWWLSSGIDKAAIKTAVQIAVSVRVSDNRTAFNSIHTTNPNRSERTAESSSTGNIIFSALWLW